MIKKIALSTLVAMVLGTGCNDVKPPSRGRGDITDHRRIFFSQTYGEQLNDSTAILEEKISRNQQTGQLTVVIPIRSAISRTQYLEYQYEFYDAHGKRVEGPMGWTPVTLEAGSPGTIQFTSVSQNADDYRVTIRYAR